MPAAMQSRKRDATQSAPNLTPMPRGSSILHKPGHAPEQPSKYDDDYILGDFDYRRVFIDIDVFMEHVLHVPENWRGLWRRTIMRIKRDETFSISYWDYRRECGIRSPKESRFYRPLVDMSNAILKFSTEDSLDEPVKLRTPPRYPRKNPEKVHPEGSNPTRAQPLQVPEVELLDDALDDGSRIPRLKVNGEQATTSRDNFSWLMKNRTRPTGEPCLPSHAPVVRGLCDHQPNYRQRNGSSSASSSPPKAACG